jgi:hypothetical protein
MRTTSSWPPRLTAYSLGRPRRERVLVVLQLAPPFSAPSAFFDVHRPIPPCDSRWSPAAIGVKTTCTSAFGTFETSHDVRCSVAVGVNRTLPMLCNSAVAPWPRPKRGTRAFLKGDAFLPRR